MMMMMKRRAKKKNPAQVTLLRISSVRADALIAHLKWGADSHYYWYSEELQFAACQPHRNTSMRGCHGLVLCQPHPSRTFTSASSAWTNLSGNSATACAPDAEDSSAS